MDWILLTTSALTGAFFGFLSSWFHDRIREKARLKGISGALWADLDRIKGEIGDPREHYVETSVFGARPVIPQIHEWVRDLIPESSTISPDVVIQFLNLERALSNLSLSVDGLRRSMENRDNTVAELNQAEAENLGQFPRTIRLQNEIEELEMGVELLHGSVVDGRKRAWRHIEAIEAHLRPNLPRSHRKKLRAAGE